MNHALFSMFVVCRFRFAAELKPVSCCPPATEGRVPEACALDSKTGPRGTCSLQLAMCRVTHARRCCPMSNRPG